MAEQIVRIGGASGAWGDSPMAIPQLLATPVDYLVMDYLAEVTMSLLARARSRDPEEGFVSDFADYLAPHLSIIATRGVRIVSNAGGINPRACRRALERAASQLGIALRIAVVEGDDLMPLMATLAHRDLREASSGAALPEKLLSANAYLGAFPIARALAAGADVVITGRCVDSALALGALIHEFGWRSDDYDRLAAGSLVGHLLECGPQVTGGLFTDWESIPDWHNIGYPIAECVADGTFSVTKPAGTGGMVSPPCVAEQVLYEIADPAAYFLPDVTADFSNVVLESVAPQCVRVSGVRGRPPNAHYKVSATYQDGFRAIGLISIVGVDAARKAERSADALIKRARALFHERGMADFSNTHIEALGAEASYGKDSRARHVREVVLRLVVDHCDRGALDLFARQLGSAGLSFAPGTTGLIGGRPKPTPLVRLFTFFIDKASLPPATVSLDRDEQWQVVVATGGGYVAPIKPSPACATAPDEPQELCSERPLALLAHARSGDKGDASNIAIFCRRPEYLTHLRRTLTAQRMAAHFEGIVEGPVARFEVPGLFAFNFVLEHALGGGGMASARIDPLGKAYGQRALEMLIPVPLRWLEELRHSAGTQA